MQRITRRQLLPTMMCLLVATLGLAGAAWAEPGTTRIARWQDDRKAVFLLMFDDSWPSHLQMAIPALSARGMTATFYINPGKGEYKVPALKKQWEQEAWRAGMVYANHTMTHKGVTDLENADWEIGECTRE